MTLSAIDWLLFFGYVVLVLAIGWFAGRRVKDAASLFTGGRNVPAWAIAVSVVATAASGATFIGGPQASYAGNLTYLSASIASVLGAVLVAWLFVPRFYAVGATTVYQAIGAERGIVAQRACAVAFLVGRLLASGARLYIAAIPCSLIVFGDLDTGHLLLSACVLGVAALVYTSWGGIRAVIWTDALQALVMVVAVVASLFVLMDQIPLELSEYPSALRNAEGGADKLVLFDLSGDLARPFTLWVVLFGLTLFNTAAFGTDQDLAQRLLTSDSAKKAAWSLVSSSVMGIGLVGLFLCVGLLLFLRDQTVGVIESEDTREVYLAFILTDLPVGLRGLLVAGLLAAAMSSTDSALNAMSSSVVIDLGWGDKDTSSRTARLVNALCGVSLVATACVFVLMEGGKNEGLIPFALGVMLYAYTGLLAVFVTTLLLKRGSARSIIAALLAGAVTVGLLQFVIETPVSFGWRMLAGFLVALAVCVSGRPR